MRLIRTDRFKRDYRKLPVRIQRQADKKLRYLVENIAHPSLRVRRVHRCEHVFEGSITKDYRLLFQITTDEYILLRIGKHDILNTSGRRPC